MNRIGIIAALPAEANCLYQSTYKLHDTVEIEKNIFVCMSGIGEKNASHAVKKLLEKNVKAVISWGVAGAIDATLQPGALLIASEIVGEDFRYISSKQWTDEIAAVLNRFAFTIYSKKITSCDSICTTPTEKIRLSQDTGAYAVDMESVAIAKIAENNNIDCVAIRAIADDRDTVIPPVVARETNALGQPKFPGFLFSCLKQPGQIITLIKLANYYSRALLTLKKIAPDLKKQHFLYN